MSDEQAEPSRKSRCERVENGEEAFECFMLSDADHEHTLLQCGGLCDWHFEHGQLWVTCSCGAAWSVNDAVGGDSVGGFCFEQVSEGDRG